MSTSSVLFVASTVLAGFAFGLAMLWVASEWLKADQETEACERSVRGSLDPAPEVEVAPEKPTP